MKRDLIRHNHGFQSFCGSGRVEDVQSVGIVRAHVCGGAGHIGVGVGSGPGDVNLVPSGIKAGVGSYLLVAHVAEGHVGAALIADRDVKRAQVQGQIAGPEAAGAGGSSAGNVRDLHQIQAAGRIDDGHGYRGGGLYLDGLLDVHIAVGAGYGNCLASGGSLDIILY